MVIPESEGICRDLAIPIDPLVFLKRLLFGKSHFWANHCHGNFRILNWSYLPYIRPEIPIEIISSTNLLGHFPWLCELLKLLKGNPTFDHGALVFFTSPSHPSSTQTANSHLTIFLDVPQQGESPWRAVAPAGCQDCPEGLHDWGPKMICNPIIIKLV